MEKLNISEHAQSTADFTAQQYNGAAATYHDAVGNSAESKAQDLMESTDFATALSRLAGLALNESVNFPTHPHASEKKSMLLGLGQAMDTRPRSKVPKLRVYGSYDIALESTDAAGNVFTNPIRPKDKSEREAEEKAVQIVLELQNARKELARQNGFFGSTYHKAPLKSFVARRQDKWSDDKRFKNGYVGAFEVEMNKKAREAGVLINPDTGKPRPATIDHATGRPVAHSTRITHDLPKSVHNQAKKVEAIERRLFAIYEAPNLIDEKVEKLEEKRDKHYANADLRRIKQAEAHKRRDTLKNIRRFGKMATETDVRINLEARDTVQDDPNGFVGVTWNVTTNNVKVTGRKPNGSYVVTILGANRAKQIHTMTEADLANYMRASGVII